MYARFSAIYNIVFSMMERKAPLYKNIVMS